MGPSPDSVPPSSGAGRSRALQDLIALLDLEPLGDGLFRGLSPKDRWQRVFGGQVLGQALIAAARTVEGRGCHSLHAYFLNPGDPRMPILYRVENSRDGGSFSARRVTASQDKRTIFTMSASFQKAEQGPEHQTEMPDVPDPGALKTETEWRSEFAEKLPLEIRDWLEHDRPVEVRPVLPANRFAPGKHPPLQILWLRAAGSLPGIPALHQCVLAYASDMTLLDTALMPHGYTLFTPHLQLASLDHAMWFHRPFRADEWLLYVQESPVAADARGFNRGTIYARGGALVASVVQEGLIRGRS